MSEDKEAQEDELLALASIYDEEEFRRAESAQGGEIQLRLELPPDFKVAVKGTINYKLDFPLRLQALFTPNAESICCPVLPSHHCLVDVTESSLVCLQERT